MLDETGRFLSVLLVACAAFMGCGLCKDNIITESRSPGGKFVASVVEQDCGATTDYTSHVRIRLSDSWLRQGDDVLVVDYRQDIRLNWAGDDHLQVEFRKCPWDKQGLKIQSEVRRWNDRVEIERREGDPWIRAHPSAESKAKLTSIRSISRPSKKSVFSLHKSVKS